MNSDKPIRDPFDIEPFKAEQEVIRLTVAQIRKDFGMFGIDIDFPLDMEMVYHDLFRELDYHVSGLLSRNVQKLSTLLYQIDLHEKTILKAWEDHPDYTHAQIIAELIIYRELKKVLFRSYYKNYKLKDLPEE